MASWKNKKLMEQIQYLRGALAQQSGETDQARSQAGAAEPQQCLRGTYRKAWSVRTLSSVWRYTPNLGFKVADTDKGDLSIGINTYARCLNQLGLDARYTDAFGNVKNVQQRQDFQLQKVKIKILGLDV